MESPETFISPTKGPMGVEAMVGEISGYVSEEPGSFYRIVIGTDSQARATDGHSEIGFVTAVIAHRVGKGGRYFWHKETVKSKKVILREKIYHETAISLDFAFKIVPKLREAISAAKYDFEIHIDVGSLGPTRDMIKEVVGMVNGNGFKAKTKPDSWGASSVADKHT